MSKTIVSVERVNEVKPHPNADRLDVVQVLGYTVVTGRGEFQVGDKAIYFPPDILLPDEVAQNLGVSKYLRAGHYPGEYKKTNCRVSACRLRGVPSYGFLKGPYEGEAEFGTDVSSEYKAVKYYPPERITHGSCLPPEPLFHTYTEIENIQKYPNAFTNETVRFTEKIHGTNARLGLVNGEFMAGSHKTRRAKVTPPDLYWGPMELVKPLLCDVVSREYGRYCIIFGEIFGPKIQDLDYGEEKPSFRAFDISVGGCYLDDDEFRSLCAKHNIPCVPELYIGPFSMEAVREYTDGKTTVVNTSAIKSKFKGREGIVIKPLVEKYSDVLGGRLILKSVSVDYHQRKGAKDDG